LLDATNAPRPRRRTRCSRRRVAIAAVDSTGFESRHASRSFVQRKESHSKQIQDVTYGRFPKLALACDSTSHLILSAVAGGGPKPDIDQLRTVLGPAL
jgi:hypothetical protein